MERHLLWGVFFVALQIHWSLQLMSVRVTVFYRTDLVFFFGFVSSGYGVSANIFGAHSAHNTAHHGGKPPHWWKAGSDRDRRDTQGCERVRKRGKRWPLRVVSVRSGTGMGTLIC